MRNICSWAAHIEIVYSINPNACMYVDMCVCVCACVFKIGNLNCFPPKNAIVCKWNFSLFGLICCDGMRSHEKHTFTFTVSHTYEKRDLPCAYKFYLGVILSIVFYTKWVCMNVDSVANFMYEYYMVPIVPLLYLWIGAMFTNFIHRVWSQSCTIYKQSFFYSSLSSFSSHWDLELHLAGSVLN